jgi:O-antigen ligase
MENDMYNQQNYESLESEDALRYYQDNDYAILGMNPAFIILLFFLGLKSLAPGILDTWRWVLGVQLHRSQLLLILFALVVVGSRILKKNSTFYTKSTKRYYFYPLLALCLLEMISIAWSGAEYQRQMFMYAVYTLCALLASVLLVSGLYGASRRRFMNNLTGFLAFVLFIYIGLSFFLSGLRVSSRFYETASVGLSWVRVHGPLVSAAAIGFLVIPIAAYCIGAVVGSRKAKLLWFFLSIYFLLVVVLSGSRAGLVGILFFLPLLAVTQRKKVLWVVFPIILLGLAAVMIWGIPERFKNLQDTDRFETYKTGIKAFYSEPSAYLFGRGHGDFYRLSGDIEPAGISMVERERGVYSRMSKYGFTLERSHSTYIKVLVETGIVGFSLVVTPLIWLFWRCYASRYRKIVSPEMTRARITLVGIIATFPLMALDHYIIQNFWIFVVWSIYAVTAAEEVKEAEYLETCKYLDHSVEEETNHYG